MKPVSKLRKTLAPQASGGPTILEIDLDRGVLFGPPDSPIAALKARNAATMKALRDGLRAGASDRQVRGLIVHVGTCPLTFAQADELGDLIEQFGRAKPTLAWSATFGEFEGALAAFRLATRANTVWLQPSGMLGITGAHLGVVLLRGGLEKLGVEPEFSQRHEYKTAADRFAAREVTGPHRAMMRRLGQSIVDESVATIARRRRLDPVAVWDAVNAAPLAAGDALARGLVDRLGYRDEVYDWARREWGVPPRPSVDNRRNADASLAFVHRHHTSPAKELMGSLAERSKPGVAIVPVTGAIVLGRGRPGAPGGRQAASDVVGEHLRAAGRDPKIKAVVLRVDSPGGSYVASDTIRREVLRLRELGKPVVASMGDLAASGGYFVAMPADEIVANPSTLTGSIGVLAGKFVTRGLFGKLGIVREGIDIGARSGMLSDERGFTDEEWETLNRWLDLVYADFTAKAAHDRGLDVPELEPNARGRVWTGSDACDRHLVDRLGGLDAAIERACERAGLRRGEAAVRSMPAIPALERLRSAESTESVSASASGVLAGMEGLARAIGLAGIVPGLGASGADAVGLAGATGPDDLVAALAHRLGFEAPGVLSLPFRVDVR
mgnify:CR=1 FL=1